jgi:NodT family efflux transporter outer membrane factor (OMF) lipoprotein
VRTTVLMAALALAGCAQLDAPGAAPQAVVAEGRFEPGDLPASAGWQALPDAQLRQLLQQALDRSPDAATAAARLAEARAALAASEAAARPQLALNASAEHQRDPRRPPGAEPTPRQRLTNSRLSLGAEAQWAPDLFGRERLAQQAALARLDAAAQDAAGSRASLVASVVQRYVELARAEADAALLRWQIRLLTEQVEARETLLVAGLLPRRAVEAEALALAEAEQQARDARHRREQARAQLALLCGAQASTFELEAAEPALLEQAPPRLASTPTAVLAARADVQAAWQRWLAAGVDAEAARRDRFPRLSFGGSGGLLADGLGRWLRSDAINWLGGVRVSLPLFDGGRLRANIAQAQAAADERGVDYRRTVLQALQEVAQALDAQTQTDERWQLARSRQARHADWVEQQDTLHRAGRLSALALREAQAQLIAAEQALVEAQAARWLAAAELQRALGQGA